MNYYSCSQGQKSSEREGKITAVEKSGAGASKRALCVCGSSKWQLYKYKEIYITFSGRGAIWNMISEAFLRPLPFVLYAHAMVCVQRAESPSSRLNYGLFDPFKRQTATDAAHKTKSSQSSPLLYMVVWMHAAVCLQNHSMVTQILCVWYYLCDSSNCVSSSSSIWAFCAALFSLLQVESQKHLESLYSCCYILYIIKPLKRSKI